MDASLTPGLTDVQRRRSVAAVILSSLGVGLAFGMGYPLTALALEARGEASFVIGLAGAAPSIAILLLLPLLPRAVARIDPISAIAWGCILSAAGYLVLYFLDSAWAWIFIRFLMGAGVALPWLIGETWINTVATDSNRTRVIAVYATAFFAGFAIGPLVLDAVGLQGALPYLIGAAGSIAALIPILLARDLAPDLAHEPATGLTGGLALAPAAMVGAFLGGYLEMSHFSLLTNVAVAAGKAESAALQLLTALLVGGLATQYLLGWLGDRMSRMTVMIGLGTFYILLALALPPMLPLSSAVVLIFATGSLVIGFYTLGLAILGEQVPPSQLATGNAAFIFSYTTGGIAGPVLTGATMTVDPVWGFVGSTALASAVLTVLTLITHRRRKPQPRA